MIMRSARYFGVKLLEKSQQRFNRGIEIIISLKVLPKQSSVCPLGQKHA